MDQKHYHIWKRTSFISPVSQQRPAAFRMSSSSSSPSATTTTTTKRSTGRKPTVVRYLENPADRTVALARRKYGLIKACALMSAITNSSVVMLVQNRVGEFFRNTIYTTPDLRDFFHSNETAAILFNKLPLEQRSANPVAAAQSRAQIHEMLLAVPDDEVDDPRVVGEYPSSHRREGGGTGPTRILELGRIDAAIGGYTDNAIVAPATTNAGPDEQQPAPKSSAKLARHLYAWVMGNPVDIKDVANDHALDCYITIELETRNSVETLSNAATGGRHDAEMSSDSGNDNAFSVAPVVPFRRIASDAPKPVDKHSNENRDSHRFHARSHTIMKKAHELGILTGADVMFMCYRGTQAHDRVHIYATHRWRPTASSDKFVSQFMQLCYRGAASRHNLSAVETTPYEISGGVPFSPSDYVNIFEGDEKALLSNEDDADTDVESAHRRTGPIVRSVSRVLPDALRGGASYFVNFSAQQSDRAMKPPSASTTNTREGNAPTKSSESSATETFLVVPMKKRQRKPATKKSVTVTQTQSPPPTQAPTPAEPENPTKRPRKKQATDGGGRKKKTSSSDDRAPSTVSV